MEKSDYKPDAADGKHTNVPADIKVIFVLPSFPVSGFCAFPILQPAFENPL